GNPNYYGTAALGGGVSGWEFDVGAGSNPTETQLWEAMTNGGVPTPGAGADRRTVLGTGPYNIPAGGSVTVQFAFVGGTDEADILANAAAAQAAVGGGGCEQSITATLDDPTPSPGQTITFAVTVTNNAASAATLDLWIDASGPANLRKRLARGTLPAGATVTRNVRVRVPGNAPSGAYAVDLNIGDFGADDICDTASFTVTVSAPRMGAGASDTEWEATVEGDPFAASATTAGAGVAVAP